MGAYVKHKFKKGFVLNEEGLRKINDILSNRFKEYHEDLKPMYKVFRKDSFTYSTSNIDDVLKEENSISNEIKAISISCENTSGIEFQLDFEAGERTLLVIEGEDRDLIYLILSDIRNYLNDEVQVKRRIIPDRFTMRMLMLILTMAFIMLFFATLLNSITSNGISEEVLISMTIEQKIDYLIQRNNGLGSSGNVLGGKTYLVLGLWLGVMIVMMFGDTLTFKVLNYLFPQNVFLIGKGIDRYEKQIGLRGKIVWTVFVGAIVSILAGFIVYILTKS